MKLTRGKTLILITIAFLALTAAALRRCTNGAAREEHPHRGPIVEAVYGLGTVTADRTYQLKIGITTSIKKIYVREGDMVEAGSPLMDLADSGKFTAPFKGTVTAIPFKTGESVFPQVPLLTLVDLTKLYLSVALEQQGALRVKADQHVTFAFESLRGKRFSGTVRAIFPADGQFNVHIDSKELPPEILPGMTADIAIEVSKKDSAMLVPVTAVSAGKLALQKAGGGRKKIDVKVGTVDDAWAEILEPVLTEEDTVFLPQK